MWLSPVQIHETIIQHISGDVKPSARANALFESPKRFSANNFYRMKTPSLRDFL